MMGSEKYDELYQAALTGSLSRRQLVKRGLAMGLGMASLSAILAACGVDDDGGQNAAPGGNPSPSPTPEPADDDVEDEDESTPEPTPYPEADDDDEDNQEEASEIRDEDIRVTGPYPGEAQSLDGAGATFPAVLYSRWFFEYENVTGVQVNYQSIGSGGGIRSIQDQVVDFGATDGPMNDEQLAEARGGHIFHVPAAMGAVVATYNIPELDIEDPLVFDADTIAGIYLGEITRWNDPALVEDNPRLAEIDQSILVVHRADGSGTTFIWTDYLSAVSETWRENVGFGTSVNWPTGIGGNGNEGVAGEVNQNTYSIGYVELIYALQNDLGVASIENQEGNVIVPTTESVTAAAAAFADQIDPELRDRIVDAPGADSYPASGFTWLLVYEDQDDEAKAIALTRMLWWAVSDAQQYNADLGYAAIPDAINDIARGMIWDIKYNGEPMFPGE
jgi:phosphate transport system substrate-binding protein